MHPLKPHSTIGIVGGGQLGRMLAMAASEMDYVPHIFTPEHHAPASQVTHHTTVAAYDDAEALTVFASACDVITFEFENVPPESLEILKSRCKVYPDPVVLKTSRHRVREKKFINECGIDTAPYAPVDSLQSLALAAREIGYPCVLKTCEMGYDGKGQVKIEREDGLQAAWDHLRTEDAILEAWIPFECEISVIAARDLRGHTLCYEPSHNLHRNHILSRTKIPLNEPDALKAEAKRIAIAMAKAIKLVGVLAVEMFVLPGGKLLVNELAPRPHNSGHWTIEAASTSQFEQQIRAITGHTLGDTTTLCPAEMINLIGEDVTHLEAYQSNPAAHIHLYGKKEIREGRKMGHVTVLHPKA